MNKLYILVTFAFTLLNCGNDDGTGDMTIPEPQIQAVTLLDLRDVANNGDATDFEFSFQRLANKELLDEYRVFIVKTEVKELFDSLTAIESSQYTSVASSYGGQTISFASDLEDVDGERVVEGTNYNFFVMAKATDDSGLGGALSASSNDLALQQKSAVRTLTGDIQAGSGGMDVDAEGNIYMADFGASLSGPPGPNVFKVTPAGSVSVFASGFVGASGNDFDSEGNLYQSNIQGGTVSKITPDGTVSTFATGFSGPVGIAFDGTSNFYVCNCSNNTISKVDQDGTVTLFSASTLLSCPNGIDIDSDGNVYIANFSSSTIVKITPEGTASSLATMPNNNMGHLLINGNYIYVVGRGANSIYRVTFGGSVTLFAGTGARGLANGSLSEATFSLPNDLAFSPDGSRMYINDVATLDATANGVISPVVIREIDLVD